MYFVSSSIQSTRGWAVRYSKLLERIWQILFIQASSKKINSNHENGKDKYYILRYISGKQTEKCMLTIIIGWLIFYIFLIGCSFFDGFDIFNLSDLFFSFIFFLSKKVENRLELLLGRNEKHTWYIARVIELETHQFQF